MKTLCRAFGTAVGNAAGLLGRGEDHRGAIAPTPPHTIFAETTLAPEECDAAVLSHVLWPLCEPGRLGHGNRRDVRPARAQARSGLAAPSAAR